MFFLIKLLLLNHGNKRFLSHSPDEQVTKLQELIASYSANIRKRVEDTDIEVRLPLQPHCNQGFREGKTADVMEIRKGSQFVGLICETT